MRTEVFYKDPQLDGRAKKLLKQLKHSVSPSISNIKIVDIYISNGIEQLSADLAEELFSDPVAQKANTQKPAALEKELADWRYLVEITYKAGVTNPVAITSKNTIEAAIGKKIPDTAIIQTATQYLIDSPVLEKNLLEKLKKVFFNPLIQQEEFREFNTPEELKKNPLPDIYPYKVVKSDVVIEKIPIHQMEEKELKEISEKRLLALSLDEMNAIKKYFTDKDTEKTRIDAGIGHEATDVELEMIAQTWSEHCKHKIFQSTIEYKDNKTGKTETIKSVF
ncbi:MAG: hypothetical protein FWF38_07245 [Spirochaetaceae bacterium]|nr:hypothetical protein [Spirochaetaceae bacterium]